MMELQALHSKTQMYTKVLDAVPFLASMGNEVNMSAMSNGLGYRTNADGTQELALSSITGVDPEMCYRFQHMYDNAQMILVGLNDTHIRLALQNSADLNNDIMFVIPWHSSGNSIAMLDMMMNAIGAEGTSAHQDYTVYENDEDVQGFIDKALKGEYKAYAENGGTMTRGQYYADRLGKLGFTEFGFNVKGTVEEGGLDRLAELVDSKADFKVVPTALQQARRDARYKIVNGTYMAKGEDRKPFTAADMAAIESSAYLQRLYDRFCVDKNSDAYQVSFASKTAEKIFPHEYWDKSADYWHARVNGDNFVEYCREMGLVPRFSQFTDEDGYWKLLIDRRMFDRQGNYREQGYVDMTEAATKLVPMTVNEATYGDTEATARAVEHVRFGRENADGTFTPSAVADWNTVLASMNGTETEMNGDALVYSLPVADQETLDFLNEQEAKGEVIKTYRTMKLLNGHLVSPKATYINGKIEGVTPLGEWEMATEHPELIKFNEKGEAYFNLDEDVRDTNARYNPYMHSSNLMINDQFKGAYEYGDENSGYGKFVTVECIVPLSEATSGYRAQYAKDPVGWTDWKAGGVAAQIAKQGGEVRRVFLSRYIKNLRIVPDAEVAQHYKTLLEGKDIAIPANVVTPGLRVELEKAGVKIGPPEAQSKAKFERMTGLRYSLDISESGSESSEGYLLSPGEYRRFGDAYQSDKKISAKQRPNGGTMVSIGNLVVYTDANGMPEQVLEIVKTDSPEFVWDENDIYTKAVQMERDGKDVSVQLEILQGMYGEGCAYFRTRGSFGTVQGETGRRTGKNQRQTRQGNRRFVSLRERQGALEDGEDGIEYSLDLTEARDYLQAMLDPEQANLEDVSTDSGDVIDDAEFHIGTGEEQYVQNGIVNDEAFEDELMDSWIQNPETRQPIAPERNDARDDVSFNRSDVAQRDVAYNRHADRFEPNDNADHLHHKMRSPQQIAKRLAKSMNIGQAIGTRNMNGMPASVLGYYNDRAKLIRVQNYQANSFVTGMHELGHAVEHKIEMTGTPDMVAKLPAMFAQHYSADELPGEAFAEWYWQYMTQANKGNNFASQDFIDDVEQAMKDKGIWDKVQSARSDMLLWTEGSTFDQIRSTIHNRSEQQRLGISERIEQIVNGIVDATHAAEPVDAMMRKQTGLKTLPISESLRQMSRMKNFAARQAFNMLEHDLIDSNGTRIGEGLGARIAATGFRATDTNIDLLNSYMLAKHSINRDAEHKPVFDEFITPQAREDFVKRIENNHKDVAAAADAFQSFRRDFMKAWMVDTGFLSEEGFNRFENMYPNYVPTLRVKDSRYQDMNRQGGKHYTIRRASGSTEDIWNPFDSFVGMMHSIVGMVTANRAALAWENAYRNYDGMGIFGSEITEDIDAQWVNLSQLSEKIENILETEVEADVLQDVLDLMKDGMMSFRRTNGTTMPNGIVVQHADGTRAFFEIYNTELYKLLGSIDGSTNNKLMQTVGRLTHMMTGLTTGMNPIFAARNFMRDFQTSVNYGSWASNYITGLGKWIMAFWDVWKSNSPLLAKFGVDPSETYLDYIGLGGGGWTRIEADTRRGANEYRQAIFQKGYNTRNIGATARFAGRKLWNTLSFARLNEYVEQASRYAEYKFGKHNLQTAEGRMEAFLASQDATVDFSRRGYAKEAQTLKQLVPFFGASMQGVARTARSFTGSEQERTPVRFVKTFVNTALLSILANMLLMVKLDKDEKDEFVRMSDSLKSTHFYFPNFAPWLLGDAPLVRIPIGQDPLMYATNGLVTNILWSGKGDQVAIDWMELGKTIIDNCNPLSNGTIFETAFGVMRNRNWYGSAIVPTRLQSETAANQYSEDTPDVFINFGRILNMSPNVLQYIAEQYTGFLGQVAIPTLSKTSGGHLGGVSSLVDSLRRKFTSDPLVSNDILSDFYRNKSWLETIKAAGKSGRPMVMLTRDMDESDAEDAYSEAKSMLSSKGVVGKTASEISKYYAQIEAIQADETLTSHQKYEQIRKIRREMIEMVLDAQEEIGDYRARYLTGYDPVFTRFLPGVAIEPQK